MGSESYVECGASVGVWDKCCVGLVFGHGMVRTAIGWPVELVKWFEASLDRV